MTRRGSAFAGVSVAIVTPFRDDAVDLAKLREQIEYLIAAGVTCVVPVGTTGESPTLDREERKTVIAETIQIVAGRIKVMAGTGSNSTREAVAMTEWAAKQGADATLQVGPYYNKPMAEGFYRHFRAAAEASPLPVCVYNVPGRTSKNVEPETIIRLAELSNVTMVKEASGSIDQSSQILAATDLTVLSGDDSLTLPILSVGGEGIVSVAANVVPERFVELCRAFDKGDLKRAQTLHLELFPLCRNMLGLASNPIPVKTAMKLQGRDSGELRLPMTPLEEDGVAKLKQTLSQAGIL
jgi:4-hydroxy-tetrahydrodipicolinate synthase